MLAVCVSMDIHTYIYIYILYIYIIYIYIYIYIYICCGNEYTPFSSGVFMFWQENPSLLDF